MPRCLRLTEGACLKTKLESAEINPALTIVVYMTSTRHTHLSRKVACHGVSTAISARLG